MYLSSTFSLASKLIRLFLTTILFINTALGQSQDHHFLKFEIGRSRAYYKVESGELPAVLSLQDYYGNAYAVSYEYHTPKLLNFDVLVRWYQESHGYSIRAAPFYPSFNLSENALINRRTLTGNPLQVELGVKIRGNILKKKVSAYYRLGLGCQIIGEVSPSVKQKYIATDDPEGATLSFTSRNFQTATAIAIIQTGFGLEAMLRQKHFFGLSCQFHYGLRDIGKHRFTYQYNNDPSNFFEQVTRGNALILSISYRVPIFTGRG